MRPGVLAINFSDLKAYRTSQAGSPGANFQIVSPLAALTTWDHPS
ncbi:hypothetical protein Vi05172_g11286 [Venturia inaequalis]|nr:hypothetical protein Vi05172_g11286 [Venturia inaequalis]